MAAVVGVLGVSAAAVAVWSPASERQEEAVNYQATRPDVIRPTRTLPPPPPNEHRILIADPPAGFHLADVREGTDQNLDRADFGPSIVYAAPGATYADGAWMEVTVSAGTGDVPPEWFGRPVRTTDINGQPGWTAPFSEGMLMTIFRAGSQEVNLRTAGLDVEQHLATARALEVSGEAATLPESARPLAVEPIETSALHIASATLFGGPFSATARYVGTNESTLLTAVVTSIDEGGDGLEEGIDFFLADREAVVVRGLSAKVGRVAADNEAITWREGNRQVTLLAVGVHRDDLVAAARSVRLGDDAGWDEDAWIEAVDAPRRHLDKGPGPDPAGYVDTRSLATGGSWNVKAELDADHPGEMRWRMRILGWPGGDLIGETERVTPSSPAIYLSFLSEWSDLTDQTEYFAAALAIGGPELEGAVLRLTADGDTGGPVESSLHRVSGVDAYVVAGAAAPWTSTFTAELIAADGRVLVTLTDLDAF